MESRLLTIADLQQHLQLSRTKCYALKRKIGFVKIGGAIRFRQEDVDQFIADSVERTAPTPKRLPVHRRKKLQFIHPDAI